MQILRVALLVVAIAAPASAQYAELSGHVLDQTGAAIGDARIRVISQGKGLEREAASDAGGSYALPALQPDEYIVRVQAAGFHTASRHGVRLSEDERVRVDFTLRVDSAVREDLTVTGQAMPAAPRPATIDVTPNEVRNVAGGGENVFRALQTLPGVTFTTDLDSRIAVRGGGPDQNLTLMDGVEIHNPYRLFRIASAFNPEVVDTFDLSTGGFSAKYGDRLSSVLLVGNREGTRDKAFTGSATLSLVDANVVAEGRLPGTSRGSWLVTGRRTYYDFQERLDDTEAPTFADVQAKVSWESRSGRRLTVFNLHSREHSNTRRSGEWLPDIAFEERVHLRTRTVQDLGAVSFSTPLGSRASSTTTVSWSRGLDAYGFDGDFINSGRRSNHPGDAATLFSDIVFTRDVEVRDLALRQEATIHRSRGPRIEVGFDSHWLRSGWAWRVDGDRATNQPDGSSQYAGAALPARLDSIRSTNRGGAWLISHWTPVSRVQAEVGVRVDWSDLTEEITSSPRLSALVDLGAGLRLRAAGGRFTQSPGYEKIFQSNYFVDLSDAESLGIRSEIARHVVVGLERRLPGGLLGRIEGFYKGFDDLLIGRLETPEDAAARAARYDFPADLAWSVPRAPQITSLPSNDGRGRAYGLDVHVSPQDASHRLTGWASYTWGKAETTAYGRTRPADYDRRHALNLVAGYRLNRLIDLAATIVVQSGFPFTPPLGVRVAEIGDAGDRDGDGNVTELVPQRDAEGLLVWAANYGDVSKLGSLTLPVYARVDLRVTFKPRWMHDRWQIYVEAINLLDRDNVSRARALLEYNPTGDRPRVGFETGTGVGILPSVGLRVRF